MNKYLLPTIKDRIGILYIDKAEIKQSEYSVIIHSSDGDFNIPVANLMCIVLGPGTSITHRAVKQIADYGCSIIWTGENLNFFYMFGTSLASSSKNILLQCKFHESKLLYNKAVHRLYEIRYPESQLKTKTLEELRGFEGLTMMKTYKKLALINDVEWDERTYHLEDFNEQTDINKAITSSNQVLYSLVTVTLNALGFSPAIGFIHTGKQMSFTYDLADLYKERFLLPKVFEWIGINKEFNDKEIKRLTYDTLIDNDIFNLIINDLNFIFYLET